MNTLDLIRNNYMTLFIKLINLSINSPTLIAIVTK